MGYKEIVCKQQMAKDNRKQELDYKISILQLVEKIPDTLVEGVVLEYCMLETLYLQFYKSCCWKNKIFKHFKNIENVALVF